MSTNTASSTANVSLLLKLVTAPQSSDLAVFSAPPAPTTLGLGSPGGGQPLLDLSVDQYLVGQYFDQDFLGDTGKIFNTFVESGQIWALLIGIVLGYLIRGLTAY
ncbi:MAG: hypothetical protein AAFZ80_01400 [Cyanobacteria bacterium P01_A01_bin.105]